MAYFTTSAAINITYPPVTGNQFSGTGPHWVDDALMDEVYATLTASGVTVTRWNVKEVSIAAHAAGNTIDVVMMPRTQIVVDAVKFIPSANIVGATDNYHTLTIAQVNGTAGTAGTIAQYAATSGTWVANIQKTITASTVASVATVTAGYTITFQMSTTGSGLAHSGGLLQVEFHEPA